MPTPSAGAILRHVHRLVGHSAHGQSDQQLLLHFIEEKEEAAFAAIVNRHGRRVWSVCRHLLRREHDAEDAFQATFLILARRAATIRKRQSLASWLHGVAYRIAMKAKTTAARRNSRERLVAMPEPISPPTELAWRELQAMLDEEVARLPEKYGVPFLLCCLEGRSRDDVAGELGWKPGTLSSRIACARRLLQKRLARRGVHLTAALTAGILWRQSASAVVPQLVLRQTVKAAVSLAASNAVDCASAGALALMEGAMRTMALTRMGAGIVVLASLVLCGIGAAGALGPAQTAPPAHEARAASNHGAREKPDALTGNAQARVDIFGEPLPADAIARLGTRRLRHAGRVTFLRFTPDGKTLIARGGDEVGLWDAKTGKLKSSFTAPIRAVVNHALAVTSDCKVLAVPTEAGMQLRNLETNAELRAIPSKRPGCACFSPDDKLLAWLSGEWSTEINLWDVAAQKPLQSWQGDIDSLAFLAFHPDGKSLITGGTLSIRIPAREHNWFRVWNVADGSLLREFDVGAHNVSTSTLSGDGRFLAFHYYWGDNDGKRIEIWDPNTGTRLHNIVVQPKVDLRGRSSFFSDIQFSPDSRTLFATGMDDCVIAFDVATGKERQRFGERIVNPQTFVLNGDATCMAVTLHTRIRLFDLPSFRERFPETHHSVPINNMLVAPDRRTVITNCANRVLAWDAETGQLLRQIGEDRDRFIAAIQLDRSGKTLQVSDLSKTMKEFSVRLYDLGSGRLVKSMETTREVGPWGLLAEDGFPFARLSNGAICVFDRLTGKELHRLAIPDSFVLGMSPSPDGKRLIAWFSNHFTHTWDIATGALLGKFSFIDPPLKDRPIRIGAKDAGPHYDAKLAPNGHSIAFGSQNGFIAIHELQTGRQIYKVDALQNVNGLSFSPDGKALLWGDTSGKLHIMEAATGKERRVLPVPGGRIRTATFFPGSKRLVTASEDTTALVWDLTGASSDDKPLSDQALDQCWAALLGADAAQAYRAIHRLARSPQRAIPFLQRRLHPVVAPDQKELARLIAALDSNSFDERESAAKKLEQIGELAVPACRKALVPAASAELRRHLEDFLEKQAPQMWVATGERLRALRALEALEIAGTKDARQLLTTLSAGAPGARLTDEAAAALARMREQ